MTRNLSFSSFRFSIGFITTLLALSCSSYPKSVEPGGLGPMAAAYRTQHGATSSKGHWSEQQSDVTGPIAMAIERGSCYGSCAEYTLAFNGLGKGCYCGRSNVELIGTYEGAIDPEVIQVMARMASSSSLFDLAPGYYTFSTDRPSVFSFLKIDDRVLLAENYDVSGPWNLWALEQFIDGLWLQVDWQKSSSLSCSQCLETVLGTGWSE